VLLTTRKSVLFAYMVNNSKSMIGATKFRVICLFKKIAFWLVSKTPNLDFLFLGSRGLRRASLCPPAPWSRASIKAPVPYRGSIFSYRPQAWILTRFWILNPDWLLLNLLAWSGIHCGFYQRGFQCFQRIPWWIGLLKTNPFSKAFLSIK